MRKNPRSDSQPPIPVSNKNFSVLLNRGKTKTDDYANAGNTSYIPVRNDTFQASSHVRTDITVISLCLTIGRRRGRDTSYLDDEQLP